MTTNKDFNSTTDTNNIKCDNWYKRVKTDDELTTELQQLRDVSSWQHNVKTSEMEILVLDTLTEELNHLDPTVVMDTIAHTQLMLKVEGEYYPVRSSAIKSLFETAKISGTALSRVSKENLADILNYCLEISRGKSLLLHRAGKVSAVLSSDTRGYGILPMEELYKVTKNAMDNRFGNSILVEGDISHEYMRAFFKLTRKMQALEEYKMFVETVYDIDSIVPGIILNSSDVGMAAATLEPVFLLDNGRYLKIGTPQKLHHKNGSTIESFEIMAQSMFSKMDKTIAKFKELAEIKIYHPHTAFMLACKKAKLPKKYATNALEDFSMMVAADEISNAHDIYFGISEVLSYAKREGRNSHDISFVEDNVTKILNFNWNELDLPGEHSW